MRSNVASHGSVAYRLWVSQGGALNALATWNGPFNLERPPSAGVYGARQAGRKITGWRGRLKPYVDTSRARCAYLLFHITAQRSCPRAFLQVAFRLSRAAATASEKSRISNGRRDPPPYPRAHGGLLGSSLAVYATRLLIILLGAGRQLETCDWVGSFCAP